MNKRDHEQLMQAAIDVRERAYAPYSRYKVGAAVADESGRIYVGTNVENASYGATICAERAAVLAMIASGGQRVTSVAVATADGGVPCGMCLQVLAEFSDPDIWLTLIARGPLDVHRLFRLADLLPRPFAVFEAERPSDPAR